MKQKQVGFFKYFVNFIDKLYSFVRNINNNNDNNNNNNNKKKQLQSCKLLQIVGFLLCIDTGSRLQMIFRIGALGKFAKFTGKHPRQSHFLNKAVSVSTGNKLN